MKKKVTSSSVSGWAFVANMFPSIESPSYGAFIQRSLEDLKRHGLLIQGLYVIAGRKKGFKKFIAYLCHMSRISFMIFRPSIGNIYLHYASHHCLPIAFAARILNKNVVVNIHGDDLVVTDTARRRMMMLGQATLVRYAKIIVVPSLFFKEKLIERYPNVCIGKIIISPSSGIDTKRFSPQERVGGNYWLKNCISKNERRVDFGYVGRIEEDKGWAVLVDAIVELSKNTDQSIRLSLWGEGSEVDLLKYKIDNSPRGLFRYMGAVSPDKVADVHREFDFHVVPSYRESLGLSALEGMAAGHVVICSRIRPFTDFAKEKSDVLFFNPGESESLKIVLENLLSFPPDLMQEISCNAMNLAKKFDRAVVSTSLVNFIKEVIDDGNSI